MTSAGNSPPAGVVRTILTDENPMLRTVCEPVLFGDGSLIQDVLDLGATLEDFRRRIGFGRAIAAPQIGILKRLIVMNLGDGPIALINPVIMSRSDEKQTVWDDCLSVPGRLAQVERSRQISVQYTNIDGAMVNWDLLGQEDSELIEHECDHLDGVLMTDNASAVKATPG